ncbi:transposase [Sporosarcina sp. Sa2YVA2]|uniref:Transposase n=1 Tax=Sporosarcina quadrami TaxID=2762234 RepID=A0ABR8UA26_9BACL|nr:transposase [Sporosarcina quadrami]MBD7984896.1 transposase [Sporosarcina quadrami]
MGRLNRKRKQQASFEQKKYAVLEILEKGRHKNEVAIELDIHKNSLTNWINIYKEKGMDGLRSSDSARETDYHSELERLREIEKKYNEQLTEIEILKKFQAFLK